MSGVLGGEQVSEPEDRPNPYPPDSLEAFAFEHGDMHAVDELPPDEDSPEADTPSEEKP